MPLFASSQDLEYAKSIVKMLASPELKGRGYVLGGDKIAAEFIGDEFRKIGLTSFKKSYFQKFTTSVNSFPSKMSLMIDGQSLIPGEDFLIEAGSPRITGKFETVQLEIQTIFDRDELSRQLRNASGKFLVVPTYNKPDYSKEQQIQITELINFLKYHPQNPASGTVILTKDKLTWSGSTVLHSKPTFTVNDSTLNEIKNISVDVENKFYEKYKSQNVIGFIEGSNSDSLVVLVAHYDHLGMMGSETVFPGANDNASGVAMLLNLAKYYQSNKPKYNTVFIAFGGEEIGLVGAKHFVENSFYDLKKIKFLINFDISGTGDDGIQVVNGSVYKDEFDRLSQINEEQQLLKQVKIRGEACNSDHCVFHMKQVPCFFIYTLGGIQAYHDIYDKAETLPLTEFLDYFRLMTEFIDGF